MAGTRATPAAEFFRIWTFFACLSIPPVLLFSFRALWATFLCLIVPALWRALTDHRKMGVRRERWVLVLLAFGAWFAFSYAWSPSERAGTDAFEMALLIALTIILFRVPPPKTWMLVMGILLSLIVLTIDIGTGNQIRQWIPPDQPLGKDAVATARGLGLTLVMLPPALLFMHRSGRGGGRWRGVVLITAFSSALSGILAYGAALLAGLAGLVSGALRPRLGLRLAGTVLGAAMAAPFALAVLLPPVAQLATWQGLPDSVLHRLVIWRTVLDLWLEGRVLMGAGARATHTLTDRLGDITIAGGVTVPQVSAHPHNIPVQLLYEFGLIGYGLAAATLVLAARSLLALNLRRDMSAAIAATVLVVSVLISVETDFWHIYFWCAVIFSALTFRAIAMDQPR